ncbi:MAG: hypothetical protein ABI156_04765 [Caldimonas sp.]
MRRRTMALRLQHCGACGAVLKRTAKTRQSSAPFALSAPLASPARIHSLSIRNGLKQAAGERVNFDRRACREQTVAAPNRRADVSRI